MKKRFIRRVIEELKSSKILEAGDINRGNFSKNSLSNKRVKSSFDYIINTLTDIIIDCDFTDEFIKELKEKEIKMKFVNAEGKRVSYECTELIEDLQHDIGAFGEDVFASVLVEELEDGVMLYKDYIILEDDENVLKITKENEKIIVMVAEDLLEILKIQDRVL